MTRRKERPLGGGNKKIPIDTTPVRFDYTGAVQTYVVPKGVKKLLVDCVGAMGSQATAKSAPGFGGRVQCVLSVKPGQTLFLYVGQAGAVSGASNAFNGGGFGAYINNSSIGANGGGASDIRINGTALRDRIIVAGGGGGSYSNGAYLKAGDGGGLLGANGGTMGAATGAGGGTQSSGGAPGTADIYSGLPGSFGQGANAVVDRGYYGGYGGGGGYYGGGSAGTSSKLACGGGGGGSSYTHPELCSDVVHTQGYNSTGNGWIILTPLEN